MGSLGPLEIGLVLLVMLLVFGAKRIPEIARGLGKGIREFKDATNDIKRELSVDDTPSGRISHQPAAPTHHAAPAETVQHQQPAAPAAPEARS